MTHRRCPGSGPRCGALAVAVAGLIARSASAQVAPANPTPDQRREAGAAFDRAVAARSSGDHAGAADLFETAYRLAPSAQALGNAIREHRDVHSPAQDARAATLSLRLIAQYGTADPRFVAFANSVVTALAPTLDRVTVQCDRCDLEVDHALTSDTEFFLEPGAHAVAGHWSDNRVAAQDVTARAGASDTVTLVAPAPTPVAVHPTVFAAPVGAAHDGESAQHHATPARGLATWSPAVFITLASLTVVSGVVLGISAADMYAGVPAYNANPTVALLRDGQAREVRTDVLIATTAALGGCAVLSTIFTRWTSGGARVEAAAPAVAALGGGVAPGLTIAGRL